MSIGRRCSQPKDRPSLRRTTLRRKLLIITALCLFVGAGGAFAATSVNTYKGTNLSFTHGSGSAKKPVPVGHTELFQAQNTDSTKASAPLKKIVVRIYGVKSNAKYFPTCSAAKMEALKSDSFCPKKSKFENGSVHSWLGNTTLLLSTRIPCNPHLDAFNANKKGKLWFFFTTSSGKQCAGLPTGATPPYAGFVKQQGKYQVTTVPLPPSVSTMVNGQTGFYGSLIKETLHWLKVTTRVNGKTVGNNMSFGCLHGKRPWSVTFTATTNGHDRQVATVKRAAKC
jgi:hypothetical protein